MKIMRFVLTTIILVVPVISGATNGYFSHGTGIKNKAMAGATNPAGMAFVGNRFDIGATLFFP